MDPSLSGLDVYDPSFEEDLNEFSDPSLSGAEDEDYGFSPDATTSTSNTTTTSKATTTSEATSKADLLNVIKKSEKVNLQNK